MEDHSLEKLEDSKRLASRNMKDKLLIYLKSGRTNIPLKLKKKTLRENDPLHCPEADQVHINNLKETMSYNVVIIT